MWNDRTKLLIGEIGTKTLERSRVAVVGVGGVGGYVAYLLARAGVGHLALVDFDRVDETNINRQIVASTATVCRQKVDVMKEIVLQINPKCQVDAICERLTSENSSKILLNDFDFVVDAIDSVQDKVELITFCKEHDIPIVSAMGAGNRICIPQFRVVDIYKTSNDGLAKVLRKKLREKGVKNLDVVTCDEPAMKVVESETDTDRKLNEAALDIEKLEKHEKRPVGSISYFPAMCGCVIAAHVTQKLLEK